MKEKDIQRYCLRYLKAKGYYFGRVNTGGIKRGDVWCKNPYTLLGVPDIIAFVNFDKYGEPISNQVVILTGRVKMVGIECKSEKGTQSPAQKEFQEWLEASGGIYIIVRKPEDIECIL